MKQITIHTNYDERIARKVIIKVGETWMNGSHGVETIVEIRGGKKHQRGIKVENVSGQRYWYSATDCGAGEYNVIANLLFKIA